MDNQFTVSAYHNYMVNGSLVVGFQIGRPGKARFFFHAPPIEFHNERPQPSITANLFDSRGLPLLHIQKGLVTENRGRLKLRKTKAGLSIRTPDGAPFFSVETIAFRNTFYTRFAGTLFDERGQPVASGTGKDFMVHTSMSTL